MRALSTSLPGWKPRRPASRECLIGVFPGEGIGPEVIGATLDVLAVLDRSTDWKFSVNTGGDIGIPAKQKTGRPLTCEAAAFCDRIFTDAGAILCGPGGGRFVYELRSEFNLFCKFSPLRPLAALAGAGPLAAHAVADVDIVMVRENASGLYFGSWGRETTRRGIARAYQHFTYDADEVGRIIQVARDLAGTRRCRLTLAIKPAGMPAISELWTEIFTEQLQNSAVEGEILEVDNTAYQLIQAAKRFDVVVSPNLFGDILADCGGLLLGSRGLCFSGNFGYDGRAVYQTGHGAAHDIAGTDRANPIGQILSLAMLLRESFGLEELAAGIESAIEVTVKSGWRTPDIAVPGCRVVGTREMGRRIADSLARLLAAPDYRT
jgi:3-isopropylmalate dehydrogenase